MTVIDVQQKSEIAPSAFIFENSSLFKNYG